MMKNMKGRLASNPVFADSMSVFRLNDVAGSQNEVTKDQPPEIRIKKEGTRDGFEGNAIYSHRQTAGAAFQRGNGKKEKYF
jgi:hypothetical protein